MWILNLSSWNLPRWSKLKFNQIYINPTKGSLKAQEFKSLEFNFIPLKKKKYKINVPILFKQMPINPVYGFFNPGSALNTYEMAHKSVELKFEVIG
jgi:hypothetical protein